MNIGNITGKMTGMIGKAKLALKIKSPEILLGAGIIFVVGGTVMACRATGKAKDVLEARHNEIAEINNRELNQINEMKDAASALGPTALPSEKVREIEKESRSDKIVANVKCAWELTKLYAPAVILEAAGIGCFIGSHTIMQRRYTGAVAAYEATNAAYRKLKEKYEQDIKALPERSEGNLSDEKAIADRVIKDGEPPFDLDRLGRYAFVFDSGCDAWRNDYEYLRWYAQAMEKQAQAKFSRDGYYILNDVREAFGTFCPGKNAEGLVIGWAKDLGDTHVDFGLRFTDGRAIWINPNCEHNIMQSKLLQIR